jgi:hypothetical protein
VAPQESMHVPISVEYLFSALFGKLNYHGYVGSVSVSTWRKDLLKTANYVRKSVEINVQTDVFHRNQLLKTCDDLANRLREARTLSAINAAAIECQTRLIFLLLGNMPDHWRRRAPYAPKFWELDGHRSLQYHQTAKQKAYLLINLVDIRQLVSIELKDYADLHEAFYRGFKSDADAFLDWFKKEHPSAYCSVF